MGTRGKPQKSVEQLLAKLALSKGMLKLKQRTAPKFPIIKTILEDLFKKQKPGTRLPSIRQLAAALETTSVPVQKVINQLTADGIVYVKPRSGIIAGPAPESPSKGNIASIEAVLKNELRIGADTRTCRLQQEYWQVARDDFCQTNPFMNVRFDYNYLHLDDPYYFDVMEVNGVTMCKELDGQKLLSLNDFIDEQNGSDGMATLALSVYYHTAYFFYNKSLMKRYMLPLPEYRSFYEQVQYIERLKKALQACVGNYKLYSTLQPFVFLGDTLSSMISEIKSRSMFYSLSERKLYLNSLSGLVKLYKLLNDHGFDDVSAMQERYFINRKAIGFIGQSLNANSLKSQTLAFDWEAYPFYCVDNTCLKIPMQTVILQNTKKPVESVRFIQQMLSDKVQQLIGQSGSVPLDMSEFSFLSPKVKEIFNEGFEASSSLIINSPEKLYLALNIINSELWNCILNCTESEVALKHIRAYGTGYMKQIRREQASES